MRGIRLSGSGEGAVQSRPYLITRDAYAPLTLGRREIAHKKDGLTEFVGYLCDPVELRTFGWNIDVENFGDGSRPAVNEI